MNTIWQSACVATGPQMAELADLGMIITFGTDAPDEIAAFCVSVHTAPVNGAITPGMFLQIDEQAYPVTAVGEVAQTNLTNLGHVTFNFDGATEPAMGGTIHVEGVVPAVSVGTTFQLIAV